MGYLGVDVAAWLELLKHLEDTLYTRQDLHAECVYRSAGIPEWLRLPFETVVQNAGRRTPVLLLNVKGVKTPDTLCLLRLRDLQALLGVQREAETAGNARKCKVSTETP